MTALFALVGDIYKHLDGSNKGLELLYALGFLAGVVAGVLGRRR